MSVPYTVNSTGATFYLNTTRSNFTYAESMCMRNGGHLAAFVSGAEQVRRSHLHEGLPEFPYRLGSLGPYLGPIVCVNKL